MKELGVVLRKTDIEITFSCGTKTYIDKEDRLLLEVYPLWTLRGKYVLIHRNLPSLYGNAKEVVLLHRAVMKPHRRVNIDHVDRDPLNNRRSNLRFATNSQNQANRAAFLGRFKGVSFCIGRNLKKPYRAYIGNRKYQFLGYFKTEEEAARAYDAEALQVYGEYALLNFPEDTACHKEKTAKERKIRDALRRDGTT